MNELKSYRSRVVHAVATVGRRSGVFCGYTVARRAMRDFRFTVLTYHHVTNVRRPWDLGARVSAADFARELDYLASNGFRIVPLCWMVDCLRDGERLRGDYVSLTFDDGYIDNYEYAYPLLRAAHLPATVFLTTAHIGACDADWRLKLGFALWTSRRDAVEEPHVGSYRLQTPKDRSFAITRMTSLLDGLPVGTRETALRGVFDLLAVDLSAVGRATAMSWDQVAEMSRNGIEFGAHTLTHVHLPGLSQDEAKAEIAGSKAMVESHLGIACRGFAYPFGACSADVASVVRDCGFDYAVTTEAIPLRGRPVDVWTTPRVSAGPGFDIFCGVVSGVYGDAVAAARHAWRRAY